jgi:uncharacterized peroxidase-related enzyme
MAEVRSIEPDDASGPLQPIYEALAERAGLVRHVYQVMAHHPDLLRSFLELEAALETMSLDPKLRELAYLAASEANRCDYDRTYHHALARRAGLSERQVQDLDQYEASDAFDVCQRDVVRYAVEVTRNLAAGDGLLPRLRRFLSDRELVELTATVALANFTNRFTRALGIDLP